MLLLIDNYDSFTHNLARYFSELGQQVKVVRNDQCNMAELVAMAPDYLVISPGPCTPDQAGISLAAIAYFAGKVPILGVCLGHQAIGQVFGGKVVRAKNIYHGKTSQIYHDNAGLFEQITLPFRATRYHSLVLDKGTLPADFIVTAHSKDKYGQFEAVMAMAHRHWPIVGVQFHPESVLTDAGHGILHNFLTMSEQGNHQVQPFREVVVAK